MRTLFCALALVLLAPVSFADSALARARVLTGAEAEVVRREGKSVRGRLEHLPFVLLRGTNEERGEAYGVLCGRDVRALLDEVLAPVINARDQESWNKLAAMVQAKFRFPEEMRAQMGAFIRGFERVTPAAERRMKSLGRDLRAVDLQVLQVFADVAGAGQVHLGGCSSFSAWGELTPDGGVVTGRNLDYTTFPGRMPLMLIAQEPAEPGRLRTLEISLAGVFGASTAMNEEGVMISLHDESGLRGEAQDGWAPRIAPLREAIETARAASAVEDVLKHLRGQPVLMGGNVHLSFPMNARKPELAPVIIEWDGNSKGGGVTVRNAANDAAPAIFCTNHYLERAPAAGRASGSSAERYKSLETEAARKRKASAKIGASEAIELMSQAAVRGPVSTYLSVVALPGERRMLAAFAAEPGKSATEAAWVEVRWESIFGAK